MKPSILEQLTWHNIREIVYASTDLEQEEGMAVISIDHPKKFFTEVLNRLKEKSH